MGEAFSSLHSPLKIVLYYHRLKSGGFINMIKLDIKGYGSMLIELDPIAAPKTVANFEALVEKGFFDGLTFHRIIKGFMIQGGDPAGNGTGGCKPEIYGEFASNGWAQNTISHKRGVISMARTSDPNSASCQFFIVHEDSEFLDGDYAAFGKVTEGIEVVDAMCKAARAWNYDGNGGVLKKDQPVINYIKVIEG
ncbi:MAG: peptidylprolyl isomerase [Oscillospiraceae bacterium]|nr:peptidylprolyl isomerase [Oscillospiraceae bacterium]